MLVTTLALGLLVAVVIRYAYKFVRYWKHFNNLPGEPSFSYLYGNLHKYPGPNEEGMTYDMGQAQKFKKFHRFWSGPIVPVIVLYHPETVKALLKSSAPKPRQKVVATPYDMGFPWLGDGLLLANGHKWFRNRHLLTPSFHFDILRSYMAIYNQCSNTLMKKLHSLSEKKKGFDIFGPISMSSLDVILQCAFSYHSDCQLSTSTNIYEESLAELARLWVDRSLTPIHFFDFIYIRTAAGKRFAHLCNVVHDIAEKIILKRKEVLEQNGDIVNTSKVRDFLDTLLTARDEDGQGLSMQDIRNEVDTFLFEGHDTTASGMSWTLYCLAQHPEHQEKVYQEIVRVMDGRDELEWNDLDKLEFTTMCIKETLRLHAAVPFIERKLDKPMEVDGYVIPEGTLVACHIWILHHNPHIWEDPNKFDPYRFTTENQAKMDPFQFVPFSAGPRNCIGQSFALNEMKVTVAQVIKNFQLRVDPDSPSARRYSSLTMRAENGAMVVAEPRSSDVH